MLGSIASILGTAIPSRAQDPGLHIERLDLRRLPAVEVRFTVRDEAGNWVPGLAPTDFAVRLDSTPIDPSTGDAAITSRFTSDDFLTIQFVVDVSGSMEQAIPAVREAIADFASRLGETDRLGLITFSESVSIPIPPGDDPGRAIAHLDSIEMEGNTALYDALVDGLASLSRRRNPRRALIAITDGADNRSYATLDQVARQAADEGIPIYAIALGSRADTAALEKLASSSGGRVLRTIDAQGLRGLYADLAGLLTSEYRLSFEVPGGADEEWHELKIELVEDAPEAIVTGRVVERSFLATTGLGASATVLQSRREARMRSDLVRIWGVAFLATLILTLIIVTIVVRSIGARSSVGLLLQVVAVAVALSAILTLIWYYHGGGR